MRERLRRGIQGLYACGPVRCVLLVSAVKIFQVDIPRRVAPAVLDAAACDITQGLHGARAQAFRPEGTSNVKPLGQSHMCSHKWLVVCDLGTVYLTLGQYRPYQGKGMPCIFVSGR